MDQSKIIILHTDKECKCCADLPSKEWLTSHLLTKWAVIIDVKNVNLNDGGGLETSVGGCDLQTVLLLHFSVERAFHYHLPLVPILDHAKLAQRVSIYMEWPKNLTPMQQPLQTF